jgi:hypothetical protein
MISARRSACTLVVAAGCASATTPGPETTTMPLTTALVANGTTMNIGGNASYVAIPTSVPLAPDSVYQLLKAAYTKLEIPVAQWDASQRSVGNDLLKTRRRLGGLSMQTILDCGAKMGLSNAETWDISMNILSFVVEDGKGGSRVSTRIQAMGHDPLVSEREMIPCGTTGGLEVRIGNTIKLLSVKKL